MKRSKLLIYFQFRSSFPIHLTLRQWRKFTRMTKFFFYIFVSCFDEIKIHCTWWWWSSVPPQSDSGFIWSQTELTFSIITAALKRALQEAFKVTLNLELSQPRHFIIAIWSKASPPLYKIPCSLAVPDMLFTQHGTHPIHWKIKPLWWRVNDQNRCHPHPRAFFVSPQGNIVGCKTQRKIWFKIEIT